MGGGGANGEERQEGDDGWKEANGTGTGGRVEKEGNGRESLVWKGNSRGCGGVG